MNSPSHSRSIPWNCVCAITPTATRTDDLPFTSKKLRECYRQGAEAFGWDKRNAEPRSMRDGSELVGWGMATGVWEALQMPTTVRVVLTANGHAEVSCATSDIGTGTYTIMAQVAADMLGVPLENVSVKLGDSTLPQSPVEGGSWTAASVSHAIVNAATRYPARRCCVWRRDAKFEARRREGGRCFAQRRQHCRDRIGRMPSVDRGCVASRPGRSN